MIRFFDPAKQNALDYLDSQVKKEKADFGTEETDKIIFPKGSTLFLVTNTPLNPIEDPATFSKPWKMRFPLYRHINPDARLNQFKCVEFVEELMYGKFRKQPVTP